MRFRRPRHRGLLRERATVADLRAEGWPLRPVRLEEVHVSGVRMDRFRGGGRRGPGKPRSRRPWRRP